MKSRLQKYIEQIRGISYSPNEISEIPQDNYVPILKANNIQDGKLDITSLIYIDKNKIKDDQFIRKGDILIAASSGSKEIVGKSLFFETPFDGSFGAFCKIIRPRENIYSGFVNSFFKTPEYRQHIRRVIQGANINNLRTEDIDSLLIPEISFPDQIRIAALLSKAEALITQRKESIRLLNEYIKNVFLEMFGDPVKNEKGWKKMRFEKVVKNENSLRVPIRHADRDIRHGEYPYYGATGIIDYIDDYKFNGEYLLIAEDGKNLLYQKRNNAFAAKGKFWVNNHAHVLSYNGICNLKYLEFFLNNIDLKPYITGVDQIKLNKENLEKIPVPVPPRKIQNQFSQIITKVEEIKEYYEISLQELENLFRSLSQRAFKGKLDLSRIKSKAIDEEIESVIQRNKQKRPIETKPQKPVKEDTRYGDPFDIDEVTAKKLGTLFYNEWLRIHGKTAEYEQESVWLQSRKNGKVVVPLKFSEAEGNVVIEEIFAKQNMGFSYQEFEVFIKKEKFIHTSKELKEFIFQKLEQKKLVQFFASKEWIAAIRDPKFNPPGGSEFVENGSIWFLASKTEKAR